MSKQILSFVCLTGFALLYLIPRAIADPTEDSDRRFLNKLENGTSAQAAPAPAPAPAAAPAPTAASPAANDQSSADPVRKSASRDSVAQKSTDSDKPAPRTHKRVAQQRTQQPAEVAEGATTTGPAQPYPVTEQKVVVVQAPDPDTDRDQDQDDHEHHHHHFFHRLFSRLLSHHPEDW